MKTAARRSYALVSFVSCVLFLISLPLSAFSQEEYVFERMWPSLPQPWYFRYPKGVSVDKSGNVYVADTDHHCIQKFSPDGTFITKWGGEGSGDGQFDRPYGISADQSGNVYVADTYNHRIQKFSPDGTFITKWGSYGSGDGQFVSPYGISADQSGNVYVADEYNNRIQKFSSEGTFIEKWGSYGYGDGQFKSPYGICTDLGGNVYVADTENDRIQKFSPEGTFITKWGSEGSGYGRFRNPQGICTDLGGNVYVADTENNRIQKFSSEGTFITAWGSQGDGYGDRQFKNPRGICTDLGGNVYVADTENNRIQKFSQYGDFLSSLGIPGSGDGQFNTPAGICEDQNGNFYVADEFNNRIQKIGPDGTFIAKWGGKGDGDGQFYYPADVTIDSGGSVYVVDKVNHRIQKFSPDGTFITKWGSYGSGDGQFLFPDGICAAPDGNIYVADTNNNRIQKFSPEGTFITKWDWGYTYDLNHPRRICADPIGNIYVVNSERYHIVKFSPDGTPITKWGSYGSGDGQFVSPYGISADLSGNLYVSDYSNPRIQKFDPNGNFITKFGKFGSDLGLFYKPKGLCISSTGSVYVVDRNNSRIQVFKPADPPARKNKAIIVAGGGPYPGNNLWDATRMCANFAYRALTYQGYTKDTIYYISHDYNKLDLDSNGIMDDVDADAANAALEYAVKTWAADAEDLFIYMVDHGGNRTFRMREFELLNASDLDSWLDDLQAVIPGKVVLLYDACRSGSFLSQLTPPAGKERITASSSGPDQNSVFAFGGSVSFSFIFWGHMFNGESFYTSYVRASQAMAMSWSQTALIDANGNGTENETEDINFAQTVKVGNETLSAGDLPAIQSVSPPQTLEGETSALLYAENVIDADGISHVWAVITPPDYSSGSSENPVSDLPVCDLLPAGNSRYEAVCKGFTAMGTYNIAVYARDGLSVMGLPKQTEVIQAKGIVKGDIDGIDSLMTLADAVIALKVLAGADTSGLIRSDYAASEVDVNGDNAVGMEEAVYILRKVAGL
ncbi:MAG: C13 family peptidase [Desulfococcaceae bacterium]